MKDRNYVLILLVLCGGLVITGVTIKAGFSYWIGCAGGIGLYMWCKDIMTGKGWLLKHNNTKQKEPAPFRKQMPELSYEEFAATLPILPNLEKEGYIELTKLCVAADRQAQLIRFFDTLKDFSQDEDYGTNLNYVMNYLDEKKFSFIMLLDWKAPVEDLTWRLTTSLQENFLMVIPLPDEADYGKGASVSFDHVFTDFDKPLRKRGLQMGFIDTQSDEYVMMIHKTEDRQGAEEAVAKIGYRYYEV